MPPFPIRNALFLALVVPLSAHAQERSITGKLTEVKVFLSGAQVTRTASTTVPAGTTTLVFAGLPQGVDPQSIQVSGKGGYSILSVNHRMNYLAESPKKKEIEEISARIKKLEKEHAQEKALQDVWVNEEQLLGKNSAIGGQQNGLTAAQLTAVNDYVRERMKAVKSGWLAQQEKMATITEELQKLRQQLQQLQAQAPRPTSEVVVEVSSTAEVQASFMLTCFVGNAGWVPAYDLRAKTVGQPIELLMKAQVVNNTGEDWSKVALSLSSGNPTLSGVMPTLRPWTVWIPDTERRAEDHRRRGVRAPANERFRDDVAIQGDDKGKEGEFAETMVTTMVSQHATTFEFVIETPFSIPSDGTAHTVGVKSHSIPAIYKHYATPKLDKDAFLYARTTGWEDLALLPGEANVFFEGTYVGKSHLDLDQPRDTLDISLGRDKGVVVERVKRKTTDQKAIVGGKRTVTIGWDLTVRNTKSTSVDLEVRDQFPLSPQSEIEVKLEDKGGATVDAQKGSLTWTLDLAARETRKLGFSYSVKHPKDMPVVLE